jgi:hypothetical protein
VVVLAKELHLGRIVAASAGAQEPPRQCVHGPGQDQVHRDRGQQSAHDRAGRRALSEHEMHDQKTERVEHRDDCDRRERRVRAVPPRRLAVTADPVAGDREHERRQPEVAERRGVDEQSGIEAADGAEDRAAQQRDGDERDKKDFRHAADHVHLREDRDLQNRRDEEQHRGLEAVDRVHRFFVGISAATTSSESNRANGVTCTVR